MAERGSLRRRPPTQLAIADPTQQDFCRQEAAFDQGASQGVPAAAPDGRGAVQVRVQGHQQRVGKDQRDSARPQPGDEDQTQTDRRKPPHRQRLPPDQRVAQVEQQQSDRGQLPGTPWRGLFAIELVWRLVHKDRLGWGRRRMERGDIFQCKPDVREGLVRLGHLRLSVRAKPQAAFGDRMIEYTRPMKAVP